MHSFARDRESNPITHQQEPEPDEKLAMLTHFVCQYDVIAPGFRERQMGADGREQAQLRRRSRFAGVSLRVLKKKREGKRNKRAVLADKKEKNRFNELVYSGKKSTRGR
jgi:hypothetical protein